MRYFKCVLAVMWLLVFSSVSLPCGAMGWWSVFVEFPGLTFDFCLFLILLEHASRYGSILCAHQVQIFEILPKACADPDGGGAPDPPPPLLKNHKNKWFLSITGPDCLKNHKTTTPAFIVGPSSARQ